MSENLAHDSSPTRPDRCARFELLAPYSEYKDSGTAWLGMIPTHWRVLPTRTLFLEAGERNNPDEPLLSVTIAHGVTRQADLLINSSKKDSSNEDKSNYKLVCPGDIAYNKMRAWQGAVGASNHRGIVSPAYVVVRPRKGHNSRYLHYLLRTPAFAKEAERWSYGITSDQWSLRPEHFKMIYCSLPPEGEQSTIVRFLDHIDRRIQRYIRAKRRLIALLNEQKQAIIHRAVTRGLDPNVRLKPSGMEWLGDVPEHWRATRLKYVAKVQTGITLGKNYGSAPLDNRPYLRVANVQDGYLDLANIATLRVPSSEVVACELKADDVLMTEGGDIDKLGRGYIWHGQIPGCLHQNHIFAVRANQSELLSEFLVALMTSRHGRSYFQKTAKKTTNLASTNSTTLKAFPIYLPPTDEQQELLEYIAQEASSLDAAFSNLRKEIEILREYRTRLIADVVTGKVDVREAAGELLEEPGEREPLEEVDALTEGDKNADDADLEVTAAEPEA